MGLHLRAATAGDREAIGHVHLQAFADDERLRVAQLALDLLDGQAQSGASAWVAEVGGHVIAHMALSPVTAPAMGHAHLLAPLGVLPEHQGHGVGSALVRHGLAAVQGALVLVYGDPAYYGRFGFLAEDAQPFVTPFPIAYPWGWQALWPPQQPRLAHGIHIRCLPALHDPDLW